MRKAGWWGAVAGLVVLSGPVRAECVSAHCYDGLAALVFGGIGYAVLGLVILVLLARAKWRRAGWGVLGAVIVLAIGVPLLTQGWQAWKLFRMEGREIVGQPPAMTGRVPLLIMLDPDCYQDLCAAVLRGRGRPGVYVLRGEALQGLDLTRPLPLADLDLEQWAEVAGQGGLPRTRKLSPTERKEVAARLDYVIVVAQGYSPQSGPLDAVLQGVGAGEAVRFAMAPLDPAEGVLSLPDLQFDVLDLSLSGQVLAVPLAPYNWHEATNTTEGVDVIAQAICPAPDGNGDETCRTALQW